MKTKGESVQCVQLSGNPALQAPEVVTYFATPEMQRGIEPVDYSRADIWAAATIVYEIFGEENPFVSDVSVIMHIFSCYFITCPVVLARLTLTTQPVYGYYNSQFSKTDTHAESMNVLGPQT